MTKSISVDEILALHDAALQAFGGMPGVRDHGTIQFAASQSQAMFGEKELYPTLAEKAAAAGFCICASHPFVDGNKRTGFLVMDTFLRKHGVYINCSQIEGEMIMLEVASGKVSSADLAQWLQAHLSGAE